MKQEQSLNYLPVPKGDSLGAAIGDTYSIQEGAGRDSTIKNTIESSPRPTKQPGWSIVNWSVDLLL